jgi:hypothetical protein
MFLGILVLAAQLQVLTREEPTIAQPAPYQALITIRHDKNWDRNLSYFRIVFGDGTAAIVIMDEELDLAKWLVENAGRKLTLTLGKEQQ